MTTELAAGKTAVITGASRGLGAALAESFAAAGLRLGLCSRSQPVLPDSDAVLAECLDVCDEKRVDAFAERCAERFGTIDLWINNAGVLEPVSPLRDVAVEDFRRHVDVNLTGVFLGTRAFVRHVRARGGEGVLINISSGAAWNPYAGWSAYCAAKSGVDRLTECVQAEEAGTGLRCHAVAPGVIDTDMQRFIRELPDERFPDVERFREMKRDDTFNTPGFVARELLAIAFDPAARPEEVVLRLPAEKG
ncbi:MAG: SDR family oxidoreductase [Proteobacteria bacterium]|nr:SDR family oxidoreductase [Pseudomonadota bacterium]